MANRGPGQLNDCGADGPGNIIGLEAAIEPLHQIPLTVGQLPLLLGPSNRLSPATAHDKRTPDDGQHSQQNNGIGCPCLGGAPRRGRYAERDAVACAVPRAFDIGRLDFKCVFTTGQIAEKTRRLPDQLLPFVFPAAQPCTIAILRRVDVGQGQEAEFHGIVLPAKLQRCSVASLQADHPVARPHRDQVNRWRPGRRLDFRRIEDQQAVVGPGGQATVGKLDDGLRVELRLHQPFSGGKQPELSTVGIQSRQTDAHQQPQIVAARHQRLHPARGQTAAGGKAPLGCERGAVDTKRFQR